MAGEPVERERNQVSGDPELEAFRASLAKQPWIYDFYYALRRMEARHSSLPRLGRAARPSDEPLRLGQEPSLAFAPASIAGYEPARDGDPARLSVFVFGMFGPNGPLPRHLTEYTRDRLRNHGDATLVRFVDILHQRLIALFYQAWAQAQSVVSLDRPDDAFSRFVASLVGLGLRAQRGRDPVPDHAKAFHAGHLVRLTRNPEGLCAALSGFFSTRVTLVEFVAHWLRLEPGQRTRLGLPGASGQLGRAAVVGKSVRDAQSKFRLEIGALPLVQYEAFLPGGSRFAQLVAWVRNYIGFELAWDARLLLRRDEVPSSRLGGRQRLGWTTWLGTRSSRDDAGDLVLDFERWSALVPARR